MEQSPCNIRLTETPMLLSNEYFYYFFTAAVRREIETMFENVDIKYGFLRFSPIYKCLASMKVKLS